MCLGTFYFFTRWRRMQLWHSAMAGILAGIKMKQVWKCKMYRMCIQKIIVFTCIQVRAC